MTGLEVKLSWDCRTVGLLPFLFCAGVLWEVWREEVRETVVQVSDSPCSSLFSRYFSGPNLRPVS